MYNQRTFKLPIRVLSYRLANRCSVIAKTVFASTNLIILSATILGSQGSVMAHPGHGMDEHGVAHWMMSPFHAGIPSAILLVGTFAAIVMVQRRLRTKSCMVRSSRR